MTVHTMTRRAVATAAPRAAVRTAGVDRTLRVAAAPVEAPVIPDGQVAADHPAPATPVSPADPASLAAPAPAPAPAAVFAWDDDMRRSIGDALALALTMAAIAAGTAAILEACISAVR